jgi:hypothetical protein
MKLQYKLQQQIVTLPLDIGALHLQDGGLRRLHDSDIRNLVNRQCRIKLDQDVGHCKLQLSLSLQRVRMVDPRRTK